MLNFDIFSLLPYLFTYLPLVFAVVALGTFRRKVLKYLFATVFFISFLMAAYGFYFPGPELGGAVLVYYSGAISITLFLIAVVSKMVSEIFLKKF